jgi:uncharacterized protein (TIGR00645 family)
MKRSRLAVVVEAGLFASRWLLAPFYVGLALGLATLLVVFVLSFGADVVHLTQTTLPKLPEAGILMSLSLIDLSLTANLVIIVILSGYENFVSRIHSVQDEDRPSWMGKVDFSNLKMKLIASIVAISAIALLRTYLEIDDHPPDPAMLRWQVAILLTFVVSGVLLALMDLIVSRTERH